MKYLNCRSFYWLAVAIALLATLLFLPGLSGSFLLDDWPNILQNTALHLYEINTLDDLLYAAYSFEPGGSSRPLAMLSFALDFRRAGLDPFAFKLTNLIIHGLSCLVLALFLRQLLLLASWSHKRAANAALLLSLLWAIHPLQVSSVLYIVQRMQTLSVLFVLLALWAYVRMRALQIEGARSQLYAVLALLFAVLAFASKEDAALIPLYCLVMELTVLQFRAAQPNLAKWLRWAFGVLALLGGVVYFFVVVPHYWHWGAYPGRDFSSVERLLTQGRVLVMYLGQIFLPMPSSMTFFYDHIPVSRSLWQPWTTLPAITLIVVLLAWAWRWRCAHPVFSFGVLLFFAGHFMTSNVINLELAYEHRNHLPLVGALLALGDVVFALLYGRVFANGVKTVCVISLIAMVSAATLFRAYIWGDNLRLAEYSLAMARDSVRAWATLCTTHFELSGKKGQEHHLDLAIETCQEGAEHLPQSAILMNNVVIYKTKKGSVTDEDWQLFLERLKGSVMSVQNKGILWVTLDNAERHMYNNERAVLKTIDIITSKTTLRPEEYLRVGAYLFNDTHEPIKAFDHLKRAVELAPVGDPAIQKMLNELAIAGRQDWVARLKEVQVKTHGEAL
ncbi:hypothetical protein [uncultured Gilvimarinus sp.]|uniref:hypothetical protein n=1 Tax=uncultured Gilvimarinus sp. TaxID=1689143 RepID=UPI0030D85678